jgi:hypothetical protein
MLVVAGFVAIGFVTVVFLLRFLVALEMDVRRPSSANWQPYAMRRHYLHLAPTSGNPAGGLVFAHRNPKLTAAEARRVEPKLVSVEKLAEGKRQLHARRSEAARLRAL